MSKATGTGTNGQTARRVARLMRETDDGIALALHYARTVAALADEMERAADHLYNRGAWVEAVWLLRSDVRDKLALFMGQRMQSQDEVVHTVNSAKSESEASE